MEGRTEDNLAPGGQSLPLGENLRMGLRVTRFGEFLRMADSLLWVVYL
jgi:hypothetical protein